MRDTVDDHVQAWAAELPWLDPVKEAILTRMAMIVRHVTHTRSGLILDEDLTLREYKTLVKLRQLGSPWETNPSTLAELVGLTRGAMSQRLARLEGRGLVARRQEGADGRWITVGLTDRGLETVERLMVEEERSELAALSGLSPDERQVLADLLRKITRSVDDHGPRNE